MLRRGLCCMGIVLLLSAYSWALDFYQAKEGAVAREKASPDAPIIYRFTAGEEFRVLDKEGGWLRVRFSSQVAGYVKEDEAETKVAQPAPSPASASASVPSPAPAAAPIDQKMHDAMEGALKPLRLLAAAMETGMNYQQYGTRLVDAKMAIEGATGEAGVALPDEFKQEIGSIFRLYGGASLIWQWKIHRPSKCDSSICLYERDDQFVQQIMSQYPFLRSTIVKEASGGIFLPEGEWAANRAMSLLWVQAKSRTEELASAVPPASSVPAVTSQTASAIPAPSLKPEERMLLA